MDDMDAAALGAFVLGRGADTHGLRSSETLRSPGGPPWGSYALPHPSSRSGNSWLRADACRSKAIDVLELPLTQENATYRNNPGSPIDAQRLSCISENPTVVPHGARTKISRAP